MTELELIIFDVDGTLYDLDDVVKVNYDIQVDFYSRKMNITPAEARTIFDQNGILSCKSDKAKSATEFFLRSGIDSDEWTAYRNNNFSPEVINCDNAASEELIQSFAEISPLVLLSSNTRNNILSVLKWININPALFADIYCTDNNPGKSPFNKTNAITGIITAKNLAAEKILSIGDRYSTDVEPLLRLGGHGAVISSPHNLQNVYEDLLLEKLCSNKFYCFY